MGIPLKPQPHGAEKSGAARQVPGLMLPNNPFISNLPHDTPGRTVIASGSEIHRPGPHTSHAGNSPGGFEGTGGQLLVGKGVGMLEGKVDGNIEGCCVGFAEMVGNCVGATEGSADGTGLIVGAVGSMLGAELGDLVASLVDGWGLTLTGTSEGSALVMLSDTGGGLSIGGGLSTGGGLSKGALVLLLVGIAVLAISDGLKVKVGESVAFGDSGDGSSVAVGNS